MLRCNNRYEATHLPTCHTAFSFSRHHEFAIRAMVLSWYGILK
jgi:hypothetical protein